MKNRIIALFLILMIVVCSLISCARPGEYESDDVRNNTAVHPDKKGSEEGEAEAPQRDRLIWSNKGYIRSPDQPPPLKGERRFLSLFR